MSMSKRAFEIWQVRQKAKADQEARLAVCRKAQQAVEAREVVK